MEPKTIDLKIAAARIGCSVAKLRRLIELGEGPAFIRLGATMNFREKTIDAWLVKRERESMRLLKRNRDVAKKVDGRVRRA